MRELRIHGRGGQGAVIASKLLAEAFFREGYAVQSFPAFGVERRGAPVTAFLRVSQHPILVRCEITEPNDLIVMDPTLVEAVDVTGGLKAGGSILINSRHPPDYYEELAAQYRVGTVNAGEIAARNGLGTKAQPIVNTPILGAFAEFTGMLPLKTVCQAIQSEVPNKAEENVAAAREAARSVRSAEVREPTHV